jgi:predicted naringenin-chalcone synthase
MGTAVPTHRHQQTDILHFMQEVYALSEADQRKLRFLYQRSGIETRYSVLADYGQPASVWSFYPKPGTGASFPSLEQRMSIYQPTALDLAKEAIEKAADGYAPLSTITHLITVSCTGMSAPGLDLALLSALHLSPSIFRTSIHFMGCYAALHALRLADALCAQDQTAQVMIVCVELCTLHFQAEPTADNLAASLLFADGAAAVWVSNEKKPQSLSMDYFYSEVNDAGKADMSWTLSSKGFLMTLSGYVPDLIQQDFQALLERALRKGDIQIEDIQHWAIHPGGKRILEAVQSALGLPAGALNSSYRILKQYGNMSSATILFVLQDLLNNGSVREGERLFLSAFGPGLTMETLFLTKSAHASY